MCLIYHGLTPNGIVEDNLLVSVIIARRDESERREKAECVY